MAFHTLDFYPSNVPQFANSEVPGGLVDGSNVTFTLAHSPSPTLSLMLYVNGQFMTEGGVDYTISGSTITFLYPPPQRAIIRAWYMY